MESPEIDEALKRAEEAVEGGDGVTGTGFWKAVAAVKADDGLATTYADRIGSIDQEAFRNWAILVVPLTLGTTFAVAGLIFGFALIGLSYSWDGLAAVAVFFVGFGVVLTASHGLGHLVVGRLVGIRFTAWFVGTLGRPQPGVKVDYSSYLRTAAQNRAWMHAAGAIVTKIVPFALLGAAVAADLPLWAVLALALVGVVMVITDISWSTKSSDWKKFRREMEFSQSP